MSLFDSGEARNSDFQVATVQVGNDKNTKHSRTYTYLTRTRTSVSTRWIHLTALTHTRTHAHTTRILLCVALFFHISLRSLISILIIWKRSCFIWFSFFWFNLRSCHAYALPLAIYFKYMRWLKINNVRWRIHRSVSFGIVLLFTWLFISCYLSLYHIVGSQALADDLTMGVQHAIEIQMNFWGKNLLDFCRLYFACLSLYLING